MNFDPKEEELHVVIERRSTGKTSFTEFLEELSQIGIIQYEIDVATGEANYTSLHSELKTGPQVDFVISNQFDRESAVQSITNITLPFLDFLRELAKAGIKTYTVNISEKKATYLGANGEEIVEPLKLVSL
jgi:uncharacterized protein YbcV (DUF1398 family)